MNNELTKKFLLSEIGKQYDRILCEIVEYDPSVTDIDADTKNGISIFEHFNDEIRDIKNLLAHLIMHEQSDE